MIAFEISRNGQKQFTAGIGSHGVLSAIVGWTLRDPETVAAIPLELREGADREELRVEVGGLANDTHHRWPYTSLQPGDEVLVRILDTETVDVPVDTEVMDRAQKLEHERDYVRSKCQQWGWTLTER